uniref:Uncharacterized protein n=2 Tax=unclassified Caudoviricetes TaxID=2788787 RepID=A0A8S5MMW8_9CAUD|nr:MAG TPA: hypothetical protein [Siphoviridae sp. ct89Z21]DAE12578.1 MAG TPA: hypothetical protein [Siphoviridae sp. ctGfm48]
MRLFAVVVFCLEANWNCRFRVFSSYRIVSTGV